MAQKCAFWGVAESGVDVSGYMASGDFRELSEVRIAERGRSCKGLVALRMLRDGADGRASRVGTNGGGIAP